MSGRVLVVDDHPLTREGLSLAARVALPGVAVVGVGSVAEAVEVMPTKPAFRLVLLDFQLSDAHGYSGLLKLQHIDPHVPIVMITAREDASLIEAAKALGAAGFVFKSRPVDEIAAILKRIVAGGTHFPAEVAASQTIAAARARIADLSPAQNAVLIALADGRSNKEIARDLDVTEATIKAHLTAIFRRLGVSNRTQALLAVRPLFEIDQPAR
ncbi:response regulator transcription factor [Sphingomonas sp.]|uniref:response regulator transcription factor n=1 Tax=Sphingomonas sp. TaxID=28214 RepID=UPI000DAF499A|nr:response regulator transcription factor [Sphingomonas sp.]PZU09815.1 MAG: DNA-binding response regulator [Sphingomonas sp.]